MRCVGTRGSMPVFVQTGRALFDVMGWLPVKGDFYSNIPDKPSLPDDSLVAVCVGVELKRNKEAHTSMRIVGDGGSGSGIQAHQLEALAAVHRDGGIARLLWCNGGEIGLLDGEQLAHAHFQYGVSVAAERMRKEVAKGARSIPWKDFTKIDFVNKPELTILPEYKEPTIAQSLKKKKLATAKKLKDEASAKVPDQLMEDIASSAIDEPETCKWCDRVNCSCDRDDDPPDQND